MNLLSYIKKWVFSIRKLKQVENPDDPRMQFINDNERIRRNEVLENKTWYLATDTELDNFYLQRVVVGLNDNPIYNRNKRQYFWAKSERECNFKKMATGVARAIVDTISNIVGDPTIKCNYEGIDDLLDETDFLYKLSNIARPLTCAVGDGCWKISYNTEFSNHPTLQFIESQDYEPVYKNGILVGVAFFSYYKDKKDKDYMLVETRTLTSNGCAIDYKLFNQAKEEIVECDLDSVDEIKEQHLESIVIPVKKLFAVPTRYYFNPLYKDRGLSIYHDKIPLFDMLDEIWTQASQTNRVSTPVEYYDTDILQRGKNGIVMLPQLYNRQYVAKNSTPDADGLNGNGQGILTTQPDLNFDKYGMLARDTLDYILIGLLSPCSFGMDIAKKDNAEAQREKEKQTIFTRDNIMSKEGKQTKDILEQLVIMDNYLKGDTSVDGVDTFVDDVDKFIHSIDISVKYSEFASPTMDSKLKSLVPPYNTDALSPERYVELLWGDTLSDDEKQHELEYLRGIKDAEHEPPMVAEEFKQDI